MKHIYIPTLLFLLPAVLTGCRMDKPEPLPDGPKYTIRLNIDRERISEEDSPLTMVKGYPNDIYAVQIYKKVINNYSKYAYGIFDDQSGMSVELPAGATYKIEMTMVPDGASVIAKDDNGGYREPFLLGGFNAGPGKVTNEFVVGIGNYINLLNSGYAVLAGQEAEANGYNRPPVSRFYGVTEITPSENTDLTIHLKWVCFGLTVVPEDFTEGSLEIEMDGAPKQTVTPDNPTAITKRIFTFEHSLSSDDWTADDYSESIPTTITWIKGDGSRLTLREPSAPITYKRKYNKQLRISCAEEDNNKVTITKEDETLIDDEEIVVHP